MEISECVGELENNLKLSKVGNVLANVLSSCTFVIHFCINLHNTLFLAFVNFLNSCFNSVFPRINILQNFINSFLSQPPFPSLHSLL